MTVTTPIAMSMDAAMARLDPWERHHRMLMLGGLALISLNNMEMLSRM